MLFTKVVCTATNNSNDKSCDEKNHVSSFLFKVLRIASLFLVNTSRISFLFLAVAKKRSLKISESGIFELSVVGIIIILDFFFPSVNVFLIRFVNSATYFFNSVKERIVGFFKEKKFVKPFAV